MATKRTAIGKRVRFEIFKRDGFKCVYCGGSPPSVLLEVDHIVPLAGGGTNAEHNLTTSCKSCNIGKGAVSLGVVPPPLKQRAAEVAEREAQLAAYSEVLNGAQERMARDCWEVIEVLQSAQGIPAGDPFRRDWYQSVRRFIEQLQTPVVVEAMEIASDKYYRNQNAAFRYFCGICWNRIKRGEF